MLTSTSGAASRRRRRRRRHCPVAVATKHGRVNMWAVKLHLGSGHKYTPMMECITYTVAIDTGSGTMKREIFIATTYCVVCVSMTMMHPPVLINADINGVTLIVLFTSQIGLIVHVHQICAKKFYFIHL